MQKKRLLWHLYPSYILITLIALLAVAWYGSRSFRTFYYNQTAKDLELSINLVEDRFSELILANDYSGANKLCRELARPRDLRLTVILPDGLVIGDSEASPDSMNNHADREEIIEAGRIGQGQSMRYSYTLRLNTIYVARQLNYNDQVIGYLRAAMPVIALDEALRGVYTRIVVAGLIIALVAAFVSLIVSRRIARPLESLTLGAQKFAAGQLDHRLPIFDSSEIGALADAMNEMASQLNDRLEAITRQKNEQEAVLSSMIEGVIAVDVDDRVISINRAAGRLLNLEPEAVQGRILQEAIRNFELQAFVTSVLGGDESAEAELSFLDEDENERFVQVRGSILRSVSGENLGAVIVMNDITRLRKLETVRKDFVSNVSHELKTPVTSIKGFVETLLEGALEDSENATRFLNIISNQANRLNAIIEDLLTLSRIEQDQEKAEIVTEPGNLNDVISGAVQVCRNRAGKKEITISVAGNGGSASVRMNQPLLEQAVINLIDNAVKYSDSGSEVIIETEVGDREAFIRVTDHGCGIAPEHIPRVFERFYRVDKARSRDLGGTGLGLAIVKHIAQAHGGRVAVKSKPGEGSTFEIIFPLSADR